MKFFLPSVYLAASLVCVSSHTLAQTLTPLSIGLMAPITGLVSAQGIEAKQITQMLLERVKKEWAALGFSLKLEVFDDKDVTKEGRRLDDLIIKSPNLVVLIGPYNSEIAITASDLFFKSNLALISPTVTTNTLTDRNLSNVNRIVARDDSQSIAATQFMIDNLGAKSVLLLNDSTTYGRGINVQISSLLRDKNIEVLGNIALAATLSSSTGTVYKDNNDYKQIIDYIKDSKPNAIFYGGRYDTVIGFLKEFRNADLNIALLGSDNLNNADFYKKAGDLAQGIYITATVAPPAAYPKAQKILEQYRKTYNTELSGTGILTYDAVQVALEALKTAVGTSKKLPTRGQVSAALRKTRLLTDQALTGAIAFNGYGDRKRSSIFVMQIGSDLNPRVNTIISVDTP